MPIETVSSVKVAKGLCRSAHKMDIQTQQVREALKANSQIKKLMMDEFDNHEIPESSSEEQYEAYLAAEKRREKWENLKKALKDFFS